MLKIHSNRLTWQQNNFNRRNEYPITVEEFFDGNLLKMDFNSILNVLIHNQTIRKADVPLIGINGMPQVRVVVIGWAMRLIGNHTHFRAILE